MLWVNDARIFTYFSTYFKLCAGILYREIMTRFSKGSISAPEKSRFGLSPKLAAWN
jgi:hypothetical protein